MSGLGVGAEQDFEACVVEWESRGRCQNPLTGATVLPEKATGDSGLKKKSMRSTMRNDAEEPRER